MYPPQREKKLGQKRNLSSNKASREAVGSSKKGKSNGESKSDEDKGGDSFLIEVAQRVFDKIFPQLRMLQYCRILKPWNSHKEDEHGGASMPRTGKSAKKAPLASAAESLTLHPVDVIPNIGISEARERRECLIFHKRNGNNSFEDLRKDFESRNSTISTGSGDVVAAKYISGQNPLHNRSGLLAGSGGEQDIFVWDLAWRPPGTVRFAWSEADVAHYWEVVLIPALKNCLVKSSNGSSTTISNEKGDSPSLAN